MKLLIVWTIIGVIVGYFKLRQSKQLGFERKVGFTTLSYILIGILLWPVLVFYIFKERKLHKKAYLRSKMIRTQLDDELDEIEKELDKLDKEINK